jgi:hypothetical protein
MRSKTTCDTCGNVIGGKPLITVTTHAPGKPEQLYDFDTTACFMAHPEGGNGGRPR